MQHSTTGIAKSIFPSTKRTQNVYWGNPLNRELQNDHSANHMMQPKSHYQNEKKVSKKGFFPQLDRIAREDPLADRNLSDLQKEHRMGTSIIAMCYDGGVIIGADSRTSTGSYVASRATNKINAICDNIYVARCGSAADSQAIIDIVKYNLAIHSVELTTPTPLVSTAANVFKYFLYNNKGHLSTGIICAGWDPHHGASVYSIAGGGTILKLPIVFMGSGSTYIYAMIDAYYKENMNKDQARQLVQKALSHAMARDGSSGGVIRTVSISKDGVERTFMSGDKVPSHNF